MVRHAEGLLMSESAINVPVRDDQPSGGRSILQRLLQIDEIGVIGALVVLIALLSILAGDKFLTAQNFINVSRQASYVGIMAVGMVFVIAMGDIDLSVGSIWMFSSVMMAIALRDNYNIWIAVAVCMIVATLCGLVNGALSVALGIPTIIVTLGTLSLYRAWAWSSAMLRRFRGTTWKPGSSPGSVAVIRSSASGSAFGPC